VSKRAAERGGGIRRRASRIWAGWTSLVLAMAGLAAVVALGPSWLSAPGPPGPPDPPGRSGRAAPAAPSAPVGPAEGSAAPPTDRTSGEAPTAGTASVPSAGPVLPSAPTGADGRIFTYSVRAAGAVRTDLEEFARAARRTYADARGWSSRGLMVFRQVPDGGDFTLWIATPERVQAFGSVCDRTWNCRSGRNVIINEVRWQSGSPSGVLAGDLAAYRAMAINHETGHWLGLSHRNCPAPGAPAPVMQQQSIDLQGCRPNPWPTEPERAAVAGRPRPTG
jgi:Protein of unknown function (DUF3152)